MIKKANLPKPLLAALTDCELSLRLAELKEEAARRTKLATGAWDAATLIPAQDYAKRAIIVAAVGEHSILFFGCKGVGKTQLRALALQLGVTESYELRPCPCGFLGAKYKACSCRNRQIGHYYRKQLGMPRADINIEVLQSSEREKTHKPGPLTYYTNQLKTALAIPAPPEVLDGPGCNLLTDAVTAFGLTDAERATIVRVAVSIARLDSAKAIGLVHLSEAIGYRPLPYLPRKS